MRSGRTLTKKEKGWDTRVNRDNKLITIEDPFEITHNLGRVVDMDGLRLISEQLRNACKTLREEGSFVSVCKKDKQSFA